MFIGLAFCRLVFDPKEPEPISNQAVVTMTHASHLRTRPVRASAAFVVLLSALVLIPGTRVADAADETLTVQKTVDHNAIYAGALSTWTIRVETNDAVGSATGISVTDALPDGLCPYGAGSADCPGGVLPSLPYSSAVENADGSWTLRWDLPEMGVSEQVEITYQTITRSHYREGGVAAGPVLARDSWNNMAHLTGTVDGSVINDYSSASQSAASFTMAKEAATRPASLTGPAVCGDGTGFDWQPLQGDGYRIGDQVCWRVTIDYPSGVTTRGTVIADTLPPGQRYTANDTWAPGAGNTVPVGDIDGSGNGPGDSALSWLIGDATGDVAPGETLEIVFSSTVVDPAATTSGDTVLNSADATHTNTAGSSYGTNAGARAEILEPDVDLIKGVIAVNDVPLGGGANVDGVQIRGTDKVTYQLTLTNTGDITAEQVEVWDLLPAWYSTCSSSVVAIADGGVCNDTTNRIEWAGAATFSIDPGTTVTKTYDVVVPAGISPKQQLENKAGVRSFTSAINNGSGSFIYYPVANIESGLGGQNTTAADDYSNVVTGDTSIGLSQTTEVGEDGNDLNWQATIGELITYTAVATIPEGTTVYDAQLVDDLPANLDFVSSSHVYTGEEALARVEDTDADSVTISWPAPSYTNASGSGDDTLTVTVVARVIDIPINARGAVVGNTATFTWFDQDGDRNDFDASVTTTIVEPLLAVDKTGADSYGNDGTVIGGETVQYSLEVTNTNAGSVSTAHDVAVIDTLPEGMTPTTINDGGVWVADPTPGDGIGGTITWDLASVEPGTPATVTYRVAIDNPVIVNSVFTNDVNITGTSMPGDVAGERSGGFGYTAADSMTLVSPLMSIGKSVIPTTATIGEEVVYSIAITVPAGMIMYDANILDVLPPGMVFDGIDSTSCAMGAGVCSPGISVDHVYTSGQTTSFFLGDVDLAAPETRTFTISYRAHVADAGSAGDMHTNEATIYGNTIDVLSDDPGFTPGPFHVATGPVESTVRLIEPDLSLDKDVSGQVDDTDYRRAQPGQTLYYTLVLRNASGLDVGPAYDITVVDSLPDDVTDPTSIFGGGVWDPGPRTITWTLPGPLAAGTSVAFDYEVTVPLSLDWTDEDPLAAELINTADVTSYFAVPGAERVANGHGYREYLDTPADVVSVELDLAEIGDRVWFDVDNDGVVDPGEPPLIGVPVTITYHGPDGILSTGDDEVTAVSTAVDGSYGGTYLPGGVYTVAVDDTVIPAGLVPSHNLDATIDHEWSGVLGEAGSNLDVDFGYTGTGSIGDAVWFDTDTDGSHGPDEYGLEGISLTVTWLGIDGIVSTDDIVYTAVTGTDGTYGLSDLPSGIYEIAVDASSLPTGMVPTHDADGVGTPHTAGLLLTAGENDLAADFGYAGTGSIGDLVWLDADGMGDIDPTETRLVGVPIQLTWPGEDGVLGGDDDDVFLTVTAAGGFYGFTNLPSGEYRVDVLGGLPAAATNTYDADGDNNSSTDVVLSAGEVFEDADFGYQGTASIGDTVWWDMNGDGVGDVGEPGIPGVHLSLTYAGLDGIPGNADDLAYNTTTDATGSYLFTDLPEGDYVVAITGGTPAGMNLTHDDNGPVDGTSTVTALGTAQIYLDADFGYNGTGAIGDFVWLDMSGNGLQDAGEPGLPGTQIQLTWDGVDAVAGSADDVILTTATDINGHYTFSGLPGGGYLISIDPASMPLGLLPTADPDGTVTPHSATTSLTAGEVAEDHDFGYVGAASVGDAVWFDRNGDGVFDPDEYGLAGVSLDVEWAGPDDSFGSPDDETFSIGTNASGRYTLGNLPTGEYLVTLDVTTLPLGMTATFDADGTLDDRTRTTLGPAGTVLDADFGYTGTGEIGDLVWLDLDEDGVHSPDEPGIPRQEVEITWAGPDGVVGNADDQAYSLVTNVFGEYLLDNLPPGVYDVAVTGHITTAAANSRDEDNDLDSHTTVALGDGAGHSTADFGYAGSVSIGDRVWLDLNGDGSADATEPGLAGVGMTATWFGADGVAGGLDDVALPESATTADGSYLLSGLPAGSYRVAVTGGVPAGLINSADEDSNNDGRIDIADLATGAVHDTADFGYAGEGSIGDSVWWDLDGNGTRSETEPGLTGAPIALTWAGFDNSIDTDDDETLGTVTTSGAYVFEHLPPGEYRVVVDGSALPADVSQSADPDGTVDGQAVVSLAAAEANTGQDFGYRGSGSVGGVVWWDVDGGGAVDTGEPGVSGAELAVTFLGSDGIPGTDDDVDFTTTTDESGSHLIPGLPSGFYRADLDLATLPVGATPHSDSDGDDPATTRFTVGVGAFEENIDFAVVGNAVLEGQVWNDRNGDGSIDPSEVGVAGVEVMAVWQGATGDVRVTTISDAFGHWAITSLPAGEYTVSVAAESIPVGMAQTTETPVAATVAGGESVAVHVGLALLLDVESKIWIDRSGDGVIDADEEGIQNVLVNLYDEAGDLVGIAETGGDGRYSFTELDPGVYLVELDRATVPEGLLATSDRDGIADFATLVDLTDGLNILDAHFGFQVGLPVTGFNLAWFAMWGALLVMFGSALVTAATGRRFVLYQETERRNRQST